MEIENPKVVSAPEPLPHPCCKRQQVGKCELVSITASQASGFLFFLGYLIYDVVKVFYYQKYYLIEDKNTIPLSVPEIIITIQITIISFATLVYYFLGSWVVEETFMDDLRKLKIGWCYLQWIIRILIVGVFGLYATVKNSLFHEWFHIDKAYQLTILYSMVIYIFFFAWDIVVMSKLWKKMKWFLLYDVLGLGLLIALYYLLHTNANQGNLIISAVILCVQMGICVPMMQSLYKLKVFHFFSKLNSKQKIR